MARPYAGNPLQPDMSAQLMVRRDTMNPRVWRLAWGSNDSPIFCYDTGECDSAGRFTAMRAAINYGLSAYGERAMKMQD